MSEVRVVGLDIAKSVFQVHGVDDAGATVLQKRLTRARLLPFFEKLPPKLHDADSGGGKLRGAERDAGGALPRPTK
jgi:transposase